MFAFLNKAFVSTNLFFSFFFVEVDEEAIELKEKVNDEEGGDDEKRKGKEQSVLQAKLTKLAIQIGYGGKFKKKILILKEI